MGDNTGINTTGIGWGAAKNNTASSVVAVGYSAEISYSCIRCNGALRRLADDRCECENCGRRCSIIDGIPNMVLCDNRQYENHVREIPSDRRWRQMVFRVIDYGLIRVYSVVYFLSAFVCTLFVKKNHKRYSHLLAADDALLQHHIKR